MVETQEPGAAVPPGDAYVLVATLIDSLYIPLPLVLDDARPTPPCMTDPQRFFFGTRGHDQALVLARMTPHAEANSSLDVPSLPAFYTRVIS